MRKFFIFLLMVCAGYCLPNQAMIPVQHATPNDWNKHSYWYGPWGKSGVHKGIDIFAKQGTPVMASTTGLVIFKGNITLGGNVVAVLGPKWRIHYYAHLQRHQTHWFAWVNRGERIGRVGTSGNALGKSPHLHYSIFSFIPNLNEITTETQGWKRMFYVNPTLFFTHPG